MTDAGSDGEPVVHRRGFTKVRGERYESVSGERVRIERQERMHKFGSGYQNTGPAVPIFTGTLRDAQLVYDVLDEWFGDDENNRNEDEA